MSVVVVYSGGVTLSGCSVIYVAALTRRCTVRWSAVLLSIVAKMSIGTGPVRHGNLLHVISYDMDLFCELAFIPIFPSPRQPPPTFGLVCLSNGLDLDCLTGVILSLCW